MLLELKYIEQKTGAGDWSNLNDKDSAWIGWVKPTRTHKSFYFNRKRFSRVEGGGPYSSNYIATDGCYYWVSGVKKRGDNRYP